MNLGQSFFKFISSSAKNELEIPPAFVLQMQEALANRSVILRDRCKNLWPVEVDRNRDKWCFKEGWPQFYEDNSLEPGNFLVFEYKGGNLFDFKLFGHDASEKKGVGALKFKEEELEEYKCEEKDEELNIQNEEYYSVDEEEEEDDDDDYDDNVDDADEDDEDYVQEEEETGEYEQVNISKKAKAENKSKSPVGVGTLSTKHKYSEKNVTGKKGNEAPICKVKEEEEEEVEDGKQNKKSADSDDVDPNDEHESNTQMEDGFDEEERQVNVSKKIKLGIGTIPSKRNYKKNADCYGADIFKSGVAVRPKNPYFVSRSRTTRKNELYIPKDVIVDYHLNIPEELFLIDERGRKWQTTIKQWKDGRLWCTKGWRSLCNVNNINKDDTCICEFVQEEGCKDPYILVHVVDRAARPDHLLSNSYV